MAICYLTSSALAIGHRKFTVTTEAEAYTTATGGGVDTGSADKGSAEDLGRTSCSDSDEDARGDELFGVIDDQPRPHVAPALSNADVAALLGELTGRRDSLHTSNPVEPAAVDVRHARRACVGLERVFFYLFLPLGSILL